MDNSTILIIEDELIIALDIKEILLNEGYDAIVCSTDFEKAKLTIVELNPSLVLIDINLKQEKDGIDIGAFLLEKNNIPFIYITSYSDKTTLERVSKTRPYGYIVKPFKSVDIKATVSIVLNNFKHRKIDVVRLKKEIKDDIPFILKKSIDFINININEKIKVSDLAQQTRWKSQHFNRLFLKYIGVTPYQYILDKKIEKATLLLTESDLPITQIAFELGIKSHSNFCVLFKKTTGKTPEDYRKWHNVNRKYTT